MIICALNCNLLEAHIAQRTNVLPYLYFCIITHMVVSLSDISLSIIALSNDKIL